MEKEKTYEHENDSPDERHTESTQPLPCPHGREPMNGQDGYKHCPHCLGINQSTPTEKQCCKDAYKAGYNWCHETRIRGADFSAPKDWEEELSDIYYKPWGSHPADKLALLKSFISQEKEKSFQEGEYAAKHRMSFEMERQIEKARKETQVERNERLTP